MPSNDILAILESRDGRLTKSAAEVLGQARRMADGLGGSVVALLMTEGAAGAAAPLGALGVGKVHLADGPAFRAYVGDLQGRVAARVARTVDPRVILLAASSQGKDLGPRLAAHLGVGLAVDCTALEITDGTLRATRPVYAGKALETLRIADPPFVASLRPNVFAPAAPAAGAGAAAVEPVETAADEAAVKTVLREVKPREGGKVELTEADVIVSGGRGMKDPANFRHLEELADVLGAAVGASRAVVDAGWRPHAEQVGQTGKTVGPNLYIACGISGAIQHLAGMSTAKCIVAVNKDPEAPIFKVADYGVVGDALEVVPALTAEIRKHQG
ncbi:MAG: electron transfer flavoprotein subunit alpha/FixB family protein [Planctomycetes bacterium]|nr:electron transfer flavoprotein subunit alpha/FixB family protein [Planctomycetota bacterium]